MSLRLSYFALIMPQLGCGREDANAAASNIPFYFPFYRDTSVVLRQVGLIIAAMCLSERFGTGTVRRGGGAYSLLANLEAAGATDDIRPFTTRGRDPRCAAADHSIIDAVSFGNQVVLLYCPHRGVLAALALEIAEPQQSGTSSNDAAMNAALPGLQVLLMTAVNSYFRLYGNSALLLEPPLCVIGSYEREISKETRDAASRGLTMTSTLAASIEAGFYARQRRSCRNLYSMNTHFYQFVQFLLTYVLLPPKPLDHPGENSYSRTWDSVWGLSHAGLFNKSNGISPSDGLDRTGASCFCPPVLTGPPYLPAWALTPMLQWLQASDHDRSNLGDITLPQIISSLFRQYYSFDLIRNYGHAAVMIFEALQKKRGMNENGKINSHLLLCPTRSSAVLYDKLFERSIGQQGCTSLLMSTILLSDALLGLRLFSLAADISVLLLYNKNHTTPRGPARGGGDSDQPFGFLLRHVADRSRVGIPEFNVRDPLLPLSLRLQSFNFNSECGSSDAELFNFALTLLLLPNSLSSLPLLQSYMFRALWPILPLIAPATTGNNTKRGRSTAARTGATRAGGSDRLGGLVSTDAYLPPDAALSLLLSSSGGCALYADPDTSECTNKNSYSDAPRLYSNSFLSLSLSLALAGDHQAYKGAHRYLTRERTFILDIFRLSNWMDTAGEQEFYPIGTSAADYHNKIIANVLSGCYMRDPFIVCGSSPPPGSSPAASEMIESHPLSVFGGPLSGLDVTNSPFRASPPGSTRPRSSSNSSTRCDEAPHNGLPFDDADPLKKAPNSGIDASSSHDFIPQSFWQVPISSLDKREQNGSMRDKATSSSGAKSHVMVHKQMILSMLMDRLHFCVCCSNDELAEDAMGHKHCPHYSFAKTDDKQEGVNSLIEEQWSRGVKRNNHNEARKDGARLAPFLLSPLLWCRSKKQCYSNILNSSGNLVTLMKMPEIRESSSTTSDDDLKRSFLSRMCAVSLLHQPGAGIGVSLLLYHVPSHTAIRSTTSPLLASALLAALQTHYPSIIARLSCSADRQPGDGEGHDATWYPNVLKFYTGGIVHGGSSGHSADEAEIYPAFHHDKELLMEIDSAGDQEYVLVTGLLLESLLLLIVGPPLRDRRRALAKGDDISDVMPEDVASKSQAKPNGYQKAEEEKIIQTLLLVFHRAIGPRRALLCELLSSVALFTSADMRLSPTSSPQPESLDRNACLEDHLYYTFVNAVLSIKVYLLKKLQSQLLHFLLVRCITWLASTALGTCLAEQALNDLYRAPVPLPLSGDGAGVKGSHDDAGARDSQPGSGRVISRTAAVIMMDSFAEHSYGGASSTMHYSFAEDGPASYTSSPRADRLATSPRRGDSIQFGHSATARLCEGNPNNTYCTPVEGSFTRILSNSTNNNAHFTNNTVDLDPFTLLREVKDQRFRGASTTDLAGWEGETSSSVEENTNEANNDDGIAHIRMGPPPIVRLLALFVHYYCCRLLLASTAPIDIPENEIGLSSSNARRSDSMSRTIKKDENNTDKDSSIIAQVMLASKQEKDERRRAAHRQKEQRRSEKKKKDAFIDNLNASLSQASDCSSSSSTSLSCFVLGNVLTTNARSDRFSGVLTRAVYKRNKAFENIVFNFLSKYHAATMNPGSPSSLLLLSPFIYISLLSDPLLMMQATAVMGTVLPSPWARALPFGSCDPGDAAVYRPLGVAMHYSLLAEVSLPALLLSLGLLDETLFSSSSGLVSPSSTWTLGDTLSDISDYYPSVSLHGGAQIIPFTPITVSPAQAQPSLGCALLRAYARRQPLAKADTGVSARSAVTDPLGNTDHVEKDTGCILLSAYTASARTVLAFVTLLIRQFSGGYIFNPLADILYNRKEICHGVGTSSDPPILSLLKSYAIGTDFIRRALTVVGDNDKKTSDNKGFLHDYLMTACGTGLPSAEGSSLRPIPPPVLYALLRFFYYNNLSGMPCSLVLLLLLGTKAVHGATVAHAITRSESEEESLRMSKATSALLLSMCFRHGSSTACAGAAMHPAAVALYHHNSLCTAVVTSNYLNAPHKQRDHLQISLTALLLSAVGMRPSNPGIWDPHSVLYHYNCHIRHDGITVQRICPPFRPPLLGSVRGQFAGWKGSPVVLGIDHGVSFGAPLAALPLTAQMTVGFLLMNLSGNSSYNYHYNNGTRLIRSPTSCDGPTCYNDGYHGSFSVTRNWSGCYSSNLGGLVTARSDHCFGEPITWCSGSWGKSIDSKLQFSFRPPSAGFTQHIGAGDNSIIANGTDESPLEELLLAPGTASYQSRFNDLLGSIEGLRAGSSVQRGLFNHCSGGGGAVDQPELDEVMLPAVLEDYYERDGNRIRCSNSIALIGFGSRATTFEVTPFSREKADAASNGRATMGDTGTLHHSMPFAALEQTMTAEMNRLKNDLVIGAHRRGRSVVLYYANHNNNGCNSSWPIIVARDAEQRLTALFSGVH